MSRRFSFLWINPGAHGEQFERIWVYEYSLTPGQEIPRKYRGKIPLGISGQIGHAILIAFAPLIIVPVMALASGIGWIPRTARDCYARCCSGLQ